MLKTRVVRKKTLGQKLSYSVHGLITKIAHVKYEHSTSSGAKVMASVKVFQKNVKLQGQGR